MLLLQIILSIILQRGILGSFLSKRKIIMIHFFPLYLRHTLQQPQLSFSEDKLDDDMLLNDIVGSSIPPLSPQDPVGNVQDVPYQIFHHMAMFFCSTASIIHTKYSIIWRC